MPDVSFNSLAVVLGLAFVTPLVLGLAPRLRLPAVVLEIVVGPSVLGWARADEPVAILATVRLAFLLFLTGLELDLELRGRLLEVAAVGFALTLVFAAVTGYVLSSVSTSSLRYWSAPCEGCLSHPNAK